MSETPKRARWVTPDGTSLVEPGSVVNAAGIAERLGLARSTIANYIQRHKEFPKPLETPGVIGIKLYVWPEVRAWFDASIAERRTTFGQNRIVEAKEEANE